MGRVAVAFAENSGLRADAGWRELVKRWALIAAVIHLIAAALSQGFYHADEHFQILEFINARLGRSPLADLPIEYARMIRPWLQPSLYGVLLGALRAVGISDPFIGAGACRLVSSAVGWLGSIGLMLCAHRLIASGKWRRVAVVATALLWYLPAFHARHSSENLGGSVFFLGLCLVLLASRWEKASSAGAGFGRLLEIPLGVALASGFLMGLAFEFRYQVGFMVFGAFFWLWLVAKAEFRALATLALGVCLAVALGTLVDRWGYGQWTFAPWNYVNFNLVENHVQDTDTNPIWDFFRRALTETWPPLGLVALLAFVVAWIRNPMGVLTWSLVPLFLVHHAIGHKELRFLFPLAHAGPVLLAMACQGIAWPKGSKVLAYALVAMNGLALAVQSLMPAWMPIRLYSFLYHYHDAEPFQLGLVGEGPYHILGNPLHFYRSPWLEQHTARDFAELGAWTSSQTKAEPGKPMLILRNGFELPPEFSAAGVHCAAQFRTLPEFLDRPSLRPALGNVKNWTVFECGG